MQGQICQHHANARANAADEIVLQEAPRSPGLLNRRPEHPECEHVEDDMPEAGEAVQKKVGEQLPHRTPDHCRGHQKQAVEDGLTANPGAEEVDDVDSDVGYDQPFHACGK